MALKFGLLLPQGWTLDLMSVKDPVEAYEALSRAAQTADEVGFTSAYLVDHLHTIPRPLQELTFECWTTAAALARDTKRIRIGQMVSCNGYRNPALLAKMASTLDVISHGRLSFGIGAGWYEHEFRAYGYEFPAGPERLRQLREAVQIILAMWTQEEASFAGKHYQISGAINQPKGVQKPQIPLLIGGDGEKVTLKLVAQYADGCNVGSNAEEVKQKLAVLKAHCEALGRDYEHIYRTTSTFCAIGATDEGAQASIPAYVRTHFPDRINLGMVGSPETIRKRLKEYEDAGVQELIIRFFDMPQLDGIRMFAREFIG
ncbi:LLM class F420-dependent oxidoreductase [Ktedonosporobacter rubrisoli]|uniref:LLM class F420-dependent oxidoreductase n=1 Tax=Ktedonosporobacter rubrisoli TaxID=2509675 RepID=A0A4P6JNP6_KTERU|nr:LLM class F420-dependent oxidoreductase [Ktedonosporobacter rubrisoli]QBD76914.1 LLM class F420-dependent oxidoreductase [Ktedonosporobacter rubrisoli]